jgi:hypothetical protein
LTGKGNLEKGKKEGLKNTTKSHNNPPPTTSPNIRIYKRVLNNNLRFRKRKEG